MEHLKFELNPIEAKNFENWLKTHECIYSDRKKVREACGIDGAVATVSFTMTTLGNVVKVKCNACGKEADITDYDSI